MYLAGLCLMVTPRLEALQTTEVRRRPTSILVIRGGDTAAQAAYLSAQADPAAGSLHLRARAGLLAERCPSVDTPWLWQLRPAELTAREYQIAMIAACGHTNQEISERLGISPRRVGNHLASTYSKLGVSGLDSGQRTRRLGPSVGFLSGIERIATT